MGWLRNATKILCITLGITQIFSLEENTADSPSSSKEKAFSSSSWRKLSSNIYQANSRSQFNQLYNDLIRTPRGVGNDIITCKVSCNSNGCTDKCTKNGWPMAAQDSPNIRVKSSRVSSSSGKKSSTRRRQKITRSRSTSSSSSSSFRSSPSASSLRSRKVPRKVLQDAKNSCSRSCATSAEGQALAASNTKTCTKICVAGKIGKQSYLSRSPVKITLKSNGKVIATNFDQKAAYQVQVLNTMNKCAQVVATNHGSSYRIKISSVSETASSCCCGAGKGSNTFGNSKCSALFSSVCKDSPGVDQFIRSEGKKTMKIEAKVRYPFGEKEIIPTTDDCEELTGGACSSSATADDISNPKECGSPNNDDDNGGCGNNSNDNECGNDSNSCGQLNDDNPTTECGANPLNDECGSNNNNGCRDDKNGCGSTNDDNNPNECGANPLNDECGNNSNNDCGDDNGCGSANNKCGGGPPADDNECGNNSGCGNNDGGCDDAEDDDDEPFYAVLKNVYEPEPIDTNESGCGANPIVQDECNSGCDDNGCADIQDEEPTDTECGGSCDDNNECNAAPMKDDGQGGCGANTISGGCDSGCGDEEEEPIGCDSGCSDDNGCSAPSDEGTSECGESEPEYPPQKDECGSNNGCVSDDEGGCGTPLNKSDSGCDSGCDTDNPCGAPPSDDGGCDTPSDDYTSPCNSDDNNSNSQYSSNKKIYDACGNEITDDNNRPECNIENECADGGCEAVNQYGISKSAGSSSFTFSQGASSSSFAFSGQSGNSNSYSNSQDPAEPETNEPETADPASNEPDDGLSSEPTQAPSVPDPVDNSDEVVPMKEENTGVKYESKQPEYTNYYDEAPLTNYENYEDYATSGDVFEIIGDLDDETDPAANPPALLVNQDQNDQPPLQAFIAPDQNGPIAGSLLDNRQEDLMKNKGFNDEAYVLDNDNDDFSSGGVFNQNSYKSPKNNANSGNSLNPTIYQAKKRQAVMRQSEQVEKIQKKSKKECADNYDPLECDLPPYEGPEDCGDNCGAPGSVIASGINDNNKCIGSDCDSVFPSEDLPGSHIVSVTANDCNPGDITCAHPIESQVNAEVQALRTQNDQSSGSPMAERLVRDSGRALEDGLARNIVGVCKQIHPRGEAVLSEASTETECCCANYFPTEERIPSLDVYQVTRYWNNKACWKPAKYSSQDQTSQNNAHYHYRRQCRAKLGVAKYQISEDQTGKKHRYRDIDECDSTIFNICGNDGYCQNGRKTFSCKCEPNYEYNVGSMRCEEKTNICYVGRSDESPHSDLKDSNNANMEGLPGFFNTFNRDLGTCGTSLGHKTKAGCCCGVDREFFSMPGALDPLKGGNGRYSWGSECSPCPTKGTTAHSRLCNGNQSRSISSFY